MARPYPTFDWSEWQGDLQSSDARQRGHRRFWVEVFRGVGSFDKFQFQCDTLFEEYVATAPQRFVHGCAGEGGAHR